MIEEGVTIFAGCVIGPRAEIGRGATLCQGVVLEHDTVVGRNAWLGPRSATSGFSEIGEHVFLGAGAIVTVRPASAGDRSSAPARSCSVKFPPTASPSAPRRESADRFDRVWMPRSPATGSGIGCVSKRTPRRAFASNQEPIPC